MTSIRPFNPFDVFRFNSCNLDPLTETYGLEFYFSYLAKWPNLFQVAEGRDGTIDAYIMGKLESSPPLYRFSEHYLPFHAHITALTVAPHARRLGLARIICGSLEAAGDASNAWFVDLFVRKGNPIAQALYRGLGYSVYRRVLDYYVDDPGGSGDGEDAFDMRKPLSRDKELKHIREKGEDFTVEPGEVW